MSIRHYIEAWCSERETIEDVVQARLYLDCLEQRFHGYIGHEGEAIYVDTDRGQGVEEFAAWLEQQQKDLDEKAEKYKRPPGRPTNHRKWNP